MADKVYYTEAESEGLFCETCGVPLEVRRAQFSYMDNAFPVELPVCPGCGFVYVPEELALGKVLRVEKSLEDK